VARNFDIIVVGGGVSGLAAAGELARSGFRVVLLEARRRLGGRVFTARRRGWRRPVELGAEYVHGGNDELWRLLARSRIRTRRLRERHWRAEGGSATSLADLDQSIARVTRLIDPARASGLSFAAYFRRFRPAVAPRDWTMARGFVEGFEAAPVGRLSARSLAAETRDEERQYAVPAGYDRVAAGLADACVRSGVEVRTGIAVRSVAWRRGAVVLSVAGAPSRAAANYSARAAVISIPLGVLKARRGAGAVRFIPEIKRQRRLIDAMGMGEVARMVFRFKPGAFRRLLPASLRTGRRGGFGFLHSADAPVPVWWSFSDQPVLVGWAGGPKAKALLTLPPALRRRRALQSLAQVLGVKPSLLAAAAAGWMSHDWSADPFSRGAYSFTAAGQDGAGRELRRPVAGTLFFCGEATAEGAEVGTVHGALRSGLRAASELKRRAGGPRRSTRSRGPTGNAAGKAGSRPSAPP
jgi:monoamine oxidase